MRGRSESEEVQSAETGGRALWDQVRFSVSALRLDLILEGSALMQVQQRRSNSTVSGLLSSLDVSCQIDGPDERVFFCCAVPAEGVSLTETQQSDQNMVTLEKNSYNFLE